MSADFSENTCRSPILRLSPHIRRRIYQYANLARWDGFPILFDLDGPMPSLSRRYDYSMCPAEKPSFHGLLLSCRTIYTEASALLYSSNRFFIHYSHKRSIQPLRHLTPSTLASITNLKIVLNESACHHRRENEGCGECCDGNTWIREGCPGWHPNQHSHPTKGSDPLAKAMLEEWQATATHLSSGISSGRLELSLVCDFDQEAVDAAKIAITSLLLLPELKDCHVRLCRSRGSELDQIAQDAVLRACNRLPPKLPSPSSPSNTRLDTIPRELRLCILGYTDLITPLKEVMWSRLQRGYSCDRAGCAAQDERGMECPADVHYTCQFWRCWSKRVIEKGDTIYYDSLGCFCRRQHAAFSSTCRCWAPPTPLFLTCRALCEDAKYVFYSGNRFVVSDGLECHNPSEPSYGWSELSGHSVPPIPSDYLAEGFAVSMFLREIVPADCLGHLRFLELVFPPYNHNCWPSDGHPAMQDWQETIEWVKDKINAPALTVRLMMGGNGPCLPRYPDNRQKMTQAQGNEVLAGYTRIFELLVRLGGNNGLARFYAYFSWPWKWTQWVDDKFNDDYDVALAWLESKERPLKEHAERLIMGTRYERLYIGDGEPKVSFWQYRYEPDA